MCYRRNKTCIAKKRCRNFILRVSLSNFYFFVDIKKTNNGNITKSCLSQWYQSPFEMNNIRYSCSEQYMMAEKARLFGDEEALDKIFKAYHPNQMKLIGS